MAKRSNFVWYKPEEWKSLGLDTTIILLDKRKHIIFRALQKKDKIPDDCLYWTTVNRLVKYCVENSDIKFLLEEDK